MPLIGFIVFKDKILNGTKTQTIRKLRKRHIRPNDKLYLYWHLRQKDCEKLGEVVCTETFLIRITKDYVHGKLCPIVYQHGGFQSNTWWRLSQKDTLELAQRDGFNTNEEFLKFFDTHYRLPISAKVIRWDNPHLNKFFSVHRNCNGRSLA